jgi:NAD(P)-dependent dehydrogenase (short-subunit alcohol dehydrogenase family)
MFSADLLKGRVALVTGGGSGIGQGIAEQYLALGATVAIVSRNAERLESAASSLRAQSAAEVATFQADVRNYEQVAAAVDAVVKRFGSLDILVNNAAGNFFCPTAEMSSNAWRTVIDIDLNGTFHGCRAAYTHLRKSNWGGSIISIITMQALSGWPGAAHAAAAKAGILSLTRTLAVEWAGEGIRVNAISPGPIGDTEGAKRIYEDRGRADQERNRVALGRFGKKQEVANAAAFLASDLASFVTGENLIVDGGRWLKYISEK